MSPEETVAYQNLAEAARCLREIQGRTETNELTPQTMPRDFLPLWMCLGHVKEACQQLACQYKQEQNYAAALALTEFPTAITKMIPMWWASEVPRIQPETWDLLDSEYHRAESGS